MYRLSIPTDRRKAEGAGPRRLLGRGAVAVVPQLAQEVGLIQHQTSRKGPHPSAGESFAKGAYKTGKGMGRGNLLFACFLFVFLCVFISVFYRITRRENGQEAMSGTVGNSH